MGNAQSLCIYIIAVIAEILTKKIYGICKTYV